MGIDDFKQHESAALGLRARVPAARHGETRGWRFFDTPSGTQMIDGCLEAMRDYVVGGVANRLGVSPTGEALERIIARAREEVRGLVKGQGYEVVFGQNMTSLAFALAQPIARDRARAGGAILISELEHFGNVDPWRRNFADHGVDANWIEVDPDTLRLADGALQAGLQAGPVYLVAVTMAANAIGTVPDVESIAAAARAAGALVVVDGVQALPHQCVDLATLRPDVFFWSAYKFYGPHLGVALIREELAAELSPYKVSLAPMAGSEKFEVGAQNHEAIAGLLGTIDALASISGGSGAEGARSTISELSGSQAAISDWIEAQLRELDAVQVYRADRSEGLLAPIVAFRHARLRPVECAQRLRQQGFFITHGDLYAGALARRLGIADTGGWARIGVAGYTRPDEAEALVAAIAEL